MQSFQFSRSGDLQSAYSAYRTADAEAADAAHSHSQYLAGGTTLLDLMKLGVMRPERVVDINDLDRTNAGLVEFAGNRLQLGALTRMSDVADHPDVRREFPVIAQSLQLAASAQCIATYPGDFAQALIALDAQVEVMGRNGSRELPFAKLHRPPGQTPHLETTLAPGELITAFRITRAPFTRRSLFLKVRDREIG